MQYQGNTAIVGRQFGALRGAQIQEGLDNTLLNLPTCPTSAARLQYNTFNVQRPIAIWKIGPCTYAMTDRSY